MYARIGSKRFSPPACSRLQLAEDVAGYLYVHTYLLTTSLLTTYLLTYYYLL